MSERIGANDATAALSDASVLTCPACGMTTRETMPAISCVITYRCSHCGIDLWPAPGDCCIFCTYGSVPCPAIQQQRTNTASM